MTDIVKKKRLTLDEIREICSELNDITIDLSMQKFVYNGHINNMEPLEFNKSSNLGKIIEEFAYFYRNDLLYMLQYQYERYICSFLEEDAVDCMVNPDNYDKYFDIVKFSPLTLRLYERDIIYVFQDDFVLVVKDITAAKKIRNLRGVK